MEFIWLNIKKIIKRHPYESILIFLVLLYVVYFTVASFLRYDNFYAGRYDLGNMDQVVWNTQHGRIFQTSTDDIIKQRVVSRLSDHADFILIVLAPFYFVWSNPKMLLLIQTIIMATGAVFVFLISRKILQNKNLSIILAFTYLINPGLQHANLYDFHAVTLATTFLLGAFYFLIEKRIVWFLLFALLAAITKEQVWLIIAFFGLYVILSQVLKYFKINQTEKWSGKQLLLGSAIFFISIGLFYYLIWYAIPNARGGNHFAISYYSDFGDGPPSIVKNIILSPQKTLGIILQNGRLHYLFQLFFPLGFLPLLSPLIIFAVPDLLINTLSNNNQLHQIYFHYTSTITPFLFISSITAIKKLKEIFPKITFNHYSVILILATIISAYFYGPLPASKNPNIDMFVKPLLNRNLIENLIHQIPKKYTVAATNNLGSHLSHRERIFTIPAGINSADVILFLLNDQFAQPSLQAQREMVESLKNNNNYSLIFEQEDFFMLQKKDPKSLLN